MPGQERVAAIHREPEFRAVGGMHGATATVREPHGNHGNEPGSQGKKNRKEHAAKKPPR
ncbi:MAG: hypothetical protein R2862_12080 [Thermoanaerobaculia bacterium]